MTAWKKKSCTVTQKSSALQCTLKLAGHGYFKISNLQIMNVTNSYAFTYSNHIRTYDLSKGKFS